MTACTDDERRRVASELRVCILDKTCGDDWRDTLLRSVAEAVGLSPDHDPTALDLCDRLADLIDPDCDEGRYDGVHTARPVDRGALLALAEGLDCKADDIIRAANHAQFSGLGPSMGEAKHDAYEWRCIARLIREALGVVA